MKKYLWIPILIILMFGGGFFIAVSNIKIETIVDNLEVNINGEYEVPSVEATFFGNIVTDDVVIKDNVDVTKFGKYTIDYQYSNFIFSKKKSIVVNVVDLEAPKIVFENGKIVPCQLNEDYNVQYTVSDNVTASDLIEVTINGEVDTSKKGIYALNYDAKDESGNIAHDYIEVVVDDFSDIDFSNRHFKMPKSKAMMPKHNYSLTEYNLLTFFTVGDSNIRDLTYAMKINPWTSLVAPCLSPSNIEDMGCLFKGEEGHKFYDMMHEIEQNRLILNIGLCDIEVSSFVMYLEQYSLLIDKILAIKPNMEIYINSILPIESDGLEGKPLNSTINLVNYYMLKMCEEKNVHFLNTQEVLKDETGLGKDEYFEDDGYHMTSLGQDVFMDYLKTHLVME